MIVVIILALIPQYNRESFGFLSFDFLFGSNNSIQEDKPEIDDEVYNLLEKADAETNDEKEHISITKENFRVLVENIRLPDEFNWESETSCIYGEDSLVEKNILSYENGRYKLEIYSADTLVKTIEDDGTTTAVTVHTPIASSNNYPSGSTDVFAEASLPTPQSFLDLPKDTLSYDFTMSKGSFGNMVDLTFTYLYGNCTYRESYRISLDYGVVLSAETYEDEVLVYKLTTSKLRGAFDKANTTQTITE